MTDHDDPQHRAYHQPDADRVEYRESGDDEGDTFSVRMPIASSGEVRNEGDEPLTRDELSGMARQINQGDVGVFLSHGRSWEISDARFGQTERLGSWQDADVVDGRAEDDPALLEAQAVMADPETLPEETGRYREALAILKEQAKRDIPLSSSIGWREDPDSPGGNDLMEASIVGIPADPETNTAQAMARAATAAGADPERLVDEVRAVVMGSDADEGGNARDSVTDTDDTEQSADDADAEQDEQDSREEQPEWAEQMLELQRETNETLVNLAEDVRQDDEDDQPDGDEEDEGDDEEDDEEEDEESSADEPDDQQDTDEEEQAAEGVEEMRDALDTLRQGGVDIDDVELPEADDDQERGTDDTEESEATSTHRKFGLDTQ